MAAAAAAAVEVVGGTPLATMVTAVMREVMVLVGEVRAAKAPAPMLGAVMALQASSSSPMNHM
jgi:hypothetical protein